MVKQPFFGLRGQHLSWAVTFCSGSAFLLFGKHLATPMLAV